MYVLLDREGHASLEDAQDFKRLKVVSTLDPSSPEGLAALGSVGRVTGDHVFLNVAILVALGPTDRGWREGLDRVVSHAAANGWTDDAGNVRAHIVREP